MKPKEPIRTLDVEATFKYLELLDKDELKDTDLTNFDKEIVQRMGEEYFYKVFLPLVTVKIGEGWSMDSVKGIIISSLNSMSLDSQVNKLSPVLDSGGCYIHDEMEYDDFSGKY